MRFVIIRLMVEKCILLIETSTNYSVDGGSIKVVREENISCHCGNDPLFL